MGNSCNQCGNELPQGAKFCTKCGNPVPENEQVNATEKVQETMDKFKESAENVSTAVKEKVKQTAQQSQEFIQSEHFQNAKNEAVKNTKNFIQRFFECNINSQEDFTRAEQRRKRCLCVIYAMIASTIFLFSFYDEYYWFNGMWYSIMEFASFLSITSRVLVIPVCIIAFIKYSIANKEIKRYQSENPEVQTHDMRMNKKAMLITLAVCIICIPVMSKINNAAYQNYLSDRSSTTDSNTSENKSETSPNTNTQQNNSSSATIKYQKDDDFIIEYAEKLEIAYGYTAKIEEIDNYNRYIVSCTAKKQYAHLTTQLIVYILWIDKNYNVDGRKETATNTNQKSRIISEMKELEIWNEEPIFN